MAEEAAGKKVNGVSESEERSASHSDDENMPSAEEEEAAVKKKYGGMLPKKPPLISKDHDRAFFDSADWALEKQGAPPDEKSEILVETLPPKLQPTPHQPLPSRRGSYGSSETEGANSGSAKETS